MKKIIYRVDDRFIHGQVLEGWINHYRIQDIVIVNDEISLDKKKTLIYSSIIPFSSKLKVLNIDDFLNFDVLNFSSQYRLVILGSIEDLFKISAKIPIESSYINIGCLATGERSVCVTDTCYLSTDDFNILKTLSESYDIFVHKVPWDEHVSIRSMIKKRETMQ